LLKKKDFFFEKKKQKTFASWPKRSISKWAACANEQKFFDSLFQKEVFLFFFLMVVQVFDRLNQW